MKDTRGQLTFLQILYKRKNSKREVNSKSIKKGGKVMKFLKSLAESPWVVSVLL